MTKQAREKKRKKEKDKEGLKNLFKHTEQVTGKTRFNTRSIQIELLNHKLCASQTLQCAESPENFTKMKTSSAESHHSAFLTSSLD